MTDILSIDELANEINNHLKSNKTLCSACNILKRYKGLDWKTNEKYCCLKYCKNILKSTLDFDIILICWKKGQSSGVHDHPDNGCILKILKGCLHEDIYCNNELTKKCSRKLEKEQLAFQLGKTGLHNVSSPDQDSISIHIYAPGCYKPKFYG